MVLSTFALMLVTSVFIQVDSGRPGPAMDVPVGCTCSDPSRVLCWATDHCDCEDGRHGNMCQYPDNQVDCSQRGQIRFVSFSAWHWTLASPRSQVYLRGFRGVSLEEIDGIGYRQGFRGIGGTVLYPEDPTFGTIQREESGEYCITMVLQNRPRHITPSDQYITFCCRRNSGNISVDYIVDLRDSVPAITEDASTDGVTMSLRDVNNNVFRRPAYVGDVLLIHIMNDIGHPTTNANYIFIEKCTASDPNSDDEVDFFINGCGDDDILVNDVFTNTLFATITIQSRVIAFPGSHTVLYSCTIRSCFSRHQCQPVICDDGSTGEGRRKRETGSTGNETTSEHILVTSLAVVEHFTDLATNPDMECGGNVDTDSRLTRERDVTVITLGVVTVVLLVVIGVLAVCVFRRSWRMRSSDEVKG